MVNADSLTGDAAGIDRDDIVTVTWINNEIGEAY